MKRLNPISRFCFLLIVLFSPFCLTAQVNFITTGAAENSNIGWGIISVNTLKQTKVLHSYPSLGAVGPGQLIAGKDGKIYGLASIGGKNLTGMVYAINTDGTGFKTLHDFEAGDTARYSSLSLGPDEKLYFINKSSLYSLTVDGTVLKKLASLPANEDRGQLIIDNEGWLYGLMWLKGATEKSIFRISIDGRGYQLLHTFHQEEDGFPQQFVAVMATNNRLYGICQTGGSSGYGTLYSMAKDGTDFKIHYSFDAFENGTSLPFAGYLAGFNSKILISTMGGGNNGLGTLLTFDTLTNEVVPIYHFTSANSFWTPIVAGDKIFVPQYNGLCRINTDGTNFQQVTSTPQPGNLIYSASGNSILYVGGGGSYKSSFIMKVDATTLSYNNIHSFGYRPEGSQAYQLVQSATGSIYGTTVEGGAKGGGTLFKMNSFGGAYHMIYDFKSDSGQLPVGGLVIAGNRLYGTCKQSGINGDVKNSVIFSIDTTGQNFTALKTFDSATEGSVTPGLSPVINDYLFGTATLPYGGSYVYKIKLDGTGFTKLKAFSGDGSEGEDPCEGLVYYNGFIYGAMARKGPSYSSGVIYRIDTDGRFYLVHSFNGSERNINQGLFLASDNKIYGTTTSGGTLKTGVVFCIDPSTLAYKVIYDNKDFPDYYYPSCKVFEASDGRLYYHDGFNLISINKDGSNPRVLRKETLYLFYNNSFIEAPIDSSCELSSDRLISSITGNSYTYQWQADAGNGFSNLSDNSLYSGVNTSILQISSVSALTNSNKYRCAVSTGESTVYTPNLTAKIQNFWLGTADTNWSNPVNWSCGKMPDANTNVFIPVGATFYPVITTTVTCKSLEVQPGASCSIGQGGKIEIK